MLEGIFVIYSIWRLPSHDACNENIFLELDSEQSETEQTGGGSGDQTTVRPGQSTVRSSSIGSPTAMVQAAIGGGTVAMERIETIDTGSSTLNNLWRPNTNTNTDSSRDLATLDCKFISGFSYFSISGFLLSKKQIHPVTTR